MLIVLLSSESRSNGCSSVCRILRRPASGYCQSTPAEGTPAMCAVCTSRIGALCFPIVVECIPIGLNRSPTPACLTPFMRKMECPNAGTVVKSSPELTALRNT